MTTARHQLRQIIDIAHRIDTSWPRFTETIRDLTETADHLGVHGGSTPDPTFGSVNENQTVTEVELDLGQALALLKVVEKRIAPITAQHPKTARLLDAEARAARCANLDCDDLAVKHGHCERHWWTHRTSCGRCQAGATA